MSIRRLLGASILLFVFAVMFGFMAIAAGMLVAIKSVGISLGVTALIYIGVVLTLDG